MKPARRTIIHSAFWLYVLLIYVLTHMPGVKIEGPIPRPDLVIHITVFGLWTALCIACGFFGPALSARNILSAYLVSLAYSAFDESTQAIPVLHRVAAWDDWFANAAGVTTAALIAFAAAYARSRAAPANHS